MALVSVRQLLDQAAEESLCSYASSSRGSPIVPRTAAAATV
jgi:hypothetical protein